MKVIASAMSIVAVLLTNIDVAGARSQAAYLGGPYHGIDSGCFSERSGGPLQLCAGRKYWIIPIVYDNHGRKNIRVSARGVNGTANTVRCRAYSVDSTGGGTRFSNYSWTRQHTGVTEYLIMDLPHAHGFGGTWVTCEMDQGTRLLNVHY